VVIKKPFEPFLVGFSKLVECWFCWQGIYFRKIKEAAGYQAIKKKPVGAFFKGSLDPASLKIY
jgi:hypothetical protein